ncbi:MAG: TFIIB-type zinc finger domain-containing protein [Eubacteriales bacterium]|nr:TFIIB-type zinc finger domain-containing protein [Eubacteriales bacterium]
MSQIAEQKCPACGAPLRFDPASGKLVCDYCGTVTELQGAAGKPGKKPGKGSSDTGKPSGKPGSQQGQTQTQGHSQTQTQQGQPQGQTEEQDATMDGFDFASMTDSVTVPDAENLPIYNCVSCGAQVIAPPEQMALTCPYCGNNIVLTDKVSGKLRPDGVIPFKIQAKDLPAAVNHFYRDKKLLPRRFFSESTMGKVTGVYIPFWVFNGKITGEMEFSAQSSSSHRSGDYIITETRYYHLAREAAMDFADLPVDASAKVDNRLMDSLEPFDSRQTQPFDMRYLAGFTADRFDEKKDDVAERAKHRMQTTVRNIVTAQASSGYSSVTPRGSRLNAQLDAKYILFPVYLFDIKHAGKNYHFAVNGQTGKVVGDIPTDSSVSFMYFFKRFAIVSGGLIAFSVAKYMLGM